MIAYKFLDADGRAPFTGFRWPPAGEGPGAWVETRVVDPCRGGVHACFARDLPIWLGAQLWEVELDGEIREEERKLVAERGRLLRRVDTWDVALLDRFAESCEARTRRRVGAVPVLSGFVGDVQRFRAERRFPMVGFAAARAAELRDGARAYETERLEQARWLAEGLGLELAG